jgi:NADP oxidoreductase coenzyme F420-dependent
MKIGIIGTGNVGSALGKGWARKGARDQLRSSRPLRSKTEIFVGRLRSRFWRSGGVRHSLGLHAGSDTQCGKNLNGQIVFDCTNPFATGSLRY